MEITKDTTFAELMQNDPAAAEELRNMGLGCGNCPMAQFETIEMGAMGHGMDTEDVLEKLESKKSKK